MWKEQSDSISLTNPTSAVLGHRACTLSILDNDVSIVANAWAGPILQLNTSTFSIVNQMPEALLDQSDHVMWGELPCVEVKRINVSAAFFLSIEFQERHWYIAFTRAASAI